MCTARDVDASARIASSGGHGVIERDFDRVPRSVDIDLEPPSMYCK